MTTDAPLKAATPVFVCQCMSLGLRVLHTHTHRYMLHVAVTTGPPVKCVSLCAAPASLASVLLMKMEVWRFGHGVYVCVHECLSSIIRRAL